MNQIAKLLKDSIRTAGQRRVGVEIERVGLWADGTSLHYQDRKVNGQDRPGAEFLLRELSKNTKWPLVNSNLGRPIGLKSPLGKVSLEPGSQLEFSTEPLCDLFGVAEHVRTFESEVSRITKPWGLYWMGLGVNPVAKVEDIDLIASDRYHIMNEYLPTKGALATSMMRLTTSLQINLDYTSEAEGVEMLRAALFAAPISYALFSNSPFSKGALSGYQSYRGRIWEETDPDRSGIFLEAFTDGYNFDCYAKYIWNLPLMFAQNNKGQYVNAKGLSLKDISEGKLPGVEANDDNQMSAVRELFTEARLKPGYVEVRSVDGLNGALRFAATAFWMGLLYFPAGRKFLLDEFGCLPLAERSNLLKVALKDGLAGQYGKCSLKKLAEAALCIAEEGLNRRGMGEGQFLKPVADILAAGKNPSAKIIEKYEKEWNHNLLSVIPYAGEQ